MGKLRTLGRLLGLALLIGAAAGIGYEIYLMLQIGSYRVVSLAEFWTVVNRPSIDALRHGLGTGTWNLLLSTYFGWPSWAALSLPGVILVILTLGRNDRGTVLTALPGR